MDPPSFSVDLGRVSLVVSWAELGDGDPPLRYAPYEEGAQSPPPGAAFAEIRARAQRADLWRRGTEGGGQLNTNLSQNGRVVADHA